MAFGSSGQTADFVSAFPDFVSKWIEGTKQPSPLPSIEAIEGRLKDAYDSAFTNLHDAIYRQEQICCKLQERVIDKLTERIVIAEQKLASVQTEVQDTLLNTYTPLYSRFHECQSKCQNRLASDLQGLGSKPKGIPDTTAWMDYTPGTPAAPLQLSVAPQVAAEMNSPSPSPSPSQATDYPADGGSRKTPFICCDEPRVWNIDAYALSEAGKKDTLAGMKESPGMAGLVRVIEDPSPLMDEYEKDYTREYPKPPIAPLFELASTEEES